MRWRQAHPKVSCEACDEQARDGDGEPDCEPCDFRLKWQALTEDAKLAWVIHGRAAAARQTGFYPLDPEPLPRSRAERVTRLVYRIAGELAEIARVREERDRAMWQARFGR